MISSVSSKEKCLKYWKRYWYLLLSQSIHLWFNKSTNSCRRWIGSLGLGWIEQWASRVRRWKLLAWFFYNCWGFLLWALIVWWLAVCLLFAVRCSLCVLRESRVNLGQTERVKVSVSLVWSYWVGCLTIGKPFIASFCNLLVLRVGCLSVRSSQWRSPRGSVAHVLAGSSNERVRWDAKSCLLASFILLRLFVVSSRQSWLCCLMASCCWLMLWCSLPVPRASSVDLDQTERVKVSVSLVWL